MPPKAVKEGLRMFLGLVTSGEKAFHKVMLKRSAGSSLRRTPDCTNQWVRWQPFTLRDEELREIL